MSASDIHFVDTTILIYVYDNQVSEKSARAQRLIDSLWEARNGCLSVQVFQEFYAATTKRGRGLLDHQTASDIISELSTWKIHTPEIKDVLSAIQIQGQYQLPFWDAMIINSASRLGCSVLWSEDLTDGQIYEGVRVVNPFSEQAASIIR